MRPANCVYSLCPAKPLIREVVPARAPPFSGRPASASGSTVVGTSSKLNLLVAMAVLVVLLAFAAAWAVSSKVDERSRSVVLPLVMAGGV